MTTMANEQAGLAGSHCVIRAFRWTDIPDAVKIEADSFSHDSWSAESFWGELAGVPARARYVVLSRDEVLVGYAGVAFVDSDAHVQTIAVAPSARGGGFGGELLDALLREAELRQSSRCLLEVQHDNAVAISMYESVGFELLSRRSRYYPGGQDALVMCCPLPVAKGARE